MAKRQRLTNSSDETTIASLLAGDTIFSIPYFQRPYKWKVERLKQLNRDLLSLVDGENDHHFLGAVIIHGRRSNPSDPDIYDVIDGQQRITTLILYLLAVVKTLCIHDEYSEAARLFQKYLVIGLDTQAASNLKIHSCKDDRVQLNGVYKDLLDDGTFREKISGFSPKYLQATGAHKGTLKSNYASSRLFFESQFEQGGLDRVRSIYTSMLEQVSVVQIDVLDAASGPKIFDGLNSRQEPMTIGDLVRNEIFSRVADEHPEVVETIDQDAWQPFYKKFQQDGKNRFDSYFFPYGLIGNSKLTKSTVYGALRENWKEMQTPREIISELAVYQDAFIDLSCGTNTQGLAKPIAQGFRRLYEAGLPTSTYPFLMRLSKSAQEGDLLDKDVLETLEVVESFLVRRAICGHEPTGLHAVFKGLWGDCGGLPSRVTVTEKIKGHRTVPWPDDTDVENAVRVRPLYSAGITRFLLIQYNNSLGGDVPNVVPWIEHVLPEKPAKEWFDVFSKEQHEILKDTLANLIPLSQQMNQGLGNKSYHHKRPVYHEDSAFKAARNFAQAYEQWDPDSIKQRADQLAAWVVNRWKY